MSHFLLGLLLVDSLCPLGVVVKGFWSTILEEFSIYLNYDLVFSWFQQFRNGEVFYVFKVLCVEAWLEDLFDSSMVHNSETLIAQQCFGSLSEIVNHSDFFLF